MPGAQLVHWPVMSVKPSSLNVPEGHVTLKTETEPELEPSSSSKEAPTTTVAPSIATERPKKSLDVASLAVNFSSCE